VYHSARTAAFAGTAQKTTHFFCFTNVTVFALHFSNVDVFGLLHYDLFGVGPKFSFVLSGKFSFRG
jgi:hypothetical protein